MSAPGKMCFLLLVSGFLFPSTVSAEDGKQRPGDSGLLYRMSDHLREAQAVIPDKDGKDRAGVWKEDAFVFPGAASSEEIRVVSEGAEGSEEKGIFFNPAQKVTRRLRFEKVPSGSRIILTYYRQTEEKKPGRDKNSTAFSSSASSHLDFSIWAGNHLVKRLLIPAEKGWKKKEIDLGVAGFLNRDIPLAFEVKGDTLEPRFLFDAEVYDA